MKNNEKEMFLLVMYKELLATPGNGWGIRSDGKQGLLPQDVIKICQRLMRLRRENDTIAFAYCNDDLTPRQEKRKKHIRDEVKSMCQHWG